MKFISDTVDVSNDLKLLAVINSSKSLDFKLCSDLKNKTLVSWLNSKSILPEGNSAIFPDFDFSEYKFFWFWITDSKI